MALCDYCVLADSGNEDIVRTAKALGWDGLCILSPGQGAKANAKSGSGHGLDMIKGFLIETKRAPDVKKEASKNRHDYEIIAVRGLDESVNRAASETPEVDILLPGPGTSVDFKTARFARQNGVRIAFEFTPLIQSSGAERGGLFSGMAKNARTVKKSRAPFVVCSGALSEWDLRAPSELAAFGKALGFDQRAVQGSLSGALLEGNRKRLSGKWVSRGVEVE